MKKQSQAERLYLLLKDGKPHRTDEIVDLIYNHGLSLARVGARIYDIKKKYGLAIEGFKDQIQPTLYWYRVKIGQLDLFK